METPKYLIELLACDRHVTERILSSTLLCTANTIQDLDVSLLPSSLARAFELLASICLHLHFLKVSRNPKFYQQMHTIFKTLFSNPFFHKNLEFRKTIVSCI